MSTSPCHLGPYAIGNMQTERPPPARSVCRSEIVIPRVASSLQKGPAFLSYWSQRRAGK